MDLSRLDGVIVPLLTPLTEERKVDERSVRALVRHVLEGGVDAVFVMGTTGEFQYLDHREQLRCTAAVLDEVAGAVPVLAGVTGFSVEETVRNITRLDGLGRPPDAVVVAPLVYHSNRKLPQHMERLAAVCGYPVLLYNNIAIVERRWKHKDIIPALLDRIVANRMVVGMKDSSGNMDYFKDIVERCARPDFVVFQAVEKLLLGSLELGTRGVVAGTANVFPSVFKELLAAFTSGKRKVAARLQERIGSAVDEYRSAPQIPAIQKEALRRRGIIATSCTFVDPPADMDRIQARLSGLFGEEA